MSIEPFVCLKVFPPGHLRRCYHLVADVFHFILVISCGGMQLYKAKKIRDQEFTNTKTSEQEAPEIDTYSPKVGHFCGSLLKIHI